MPRSFVLPALAFVVASTVPVHAVPRPRVVSLCLNLLAIRAKAPVINVDRRSRDEVAAAGEAARRSQVVSVVEVDGRLDPHAAVAAKSRESPALEQSLRRVHALLDDLGDQRVRKSVLFVRGFEDMREITRTLARDGADLDGVLDSYSPARALGHEAPHTRTAVLDVLPDAEDAYYHLGATVTVPRGFLGVLERMAGHEDFDLYDLQRAVEHARDLPGDGDLLLFDQFVYRSPAATEYTYLGVVRLREARPVIAAVH